MISLFSKCFKLIATAALLAAALPAEAGNPTLENALGARAGDDAVSRVCKRLLFVDFSYYEDDEVAGALRKAGARQMAQKMAQLFSEDTTVSSVLPRHDQFVEFLESYFSDSFSVRDIEYKRVQKQLFSPNLQKIVDASLKSCREKGKVRKFFH